MIHLRGQDLSTGVRFMFTGVSSMEATKRVIICKNGACLMMEWVRMFLELEVCSRVMILLIGLMGVVRDLLAILGIV
jgi:hypothetical protein